MLGWDSAWDCCCRTGSILECKVQVKRVQRPHSPHDCLMLNGSKTVPFDHKPMSRCCYQGRERGSHVVDRQTARVDP